jgi:hypothetical protein
VYAAGMDIDPHLYLIVLDLRAQDDVLVVACWKERYGFGDLRMSGIAWISALVTPGYGY